MTPTRSWFLPTLMLAAPCGAAPWSIALGTSLDEEAAAVAGSRNGTILVGGSQRVGTCVRDCRTSRRLRSDRPLDDLAAACDSPRLMNAAQRHHHHHHSHAGGR